MQNRKSGKICWKTLVCLWGLILLACLLIFHNFILGNETLVFGDIGSDTKQQYIMWYNGIVNDLRAGRFSMWDFNNGYGVNVFNYSLFEPFLLLVYAVGTVFGPDRIALAMVWVQILKILLSGTFCYFFLSEYRTREAAKLAASFMYAFNAYLMIWGQHYQMGTVVVFLPLLFWFVEKTVLNRKAAFAVALMSGAIILSGYYQGYMIMLGVGIYVTIRVLVFEMTEMKVRLKTFFAIGGAMAFGVGIGALNLLPSAKIATSVSSRLDSEGGLLAKNIFLWMREYYKTLVYRLFGSNLQGTGNNYFGAYNYYEAICLFFSTLFVILLIQYVFTIHRQQRPLRQKLAQYLGGLVCVFLITIRIGSMIFNGLAYAFSRHVFLFMPLFALLSARVLDQILEEKKISWLGLLIAAVGMTGVYALSYKYVDDVNADTNTLMLCMTGLGMVLILALIARRKFEEKQLLMMLVLLLFINVVSDTTLDYRYRDTVKKNDVGYFDATYHSSVNDALDWIESQDDSFYRTEKDFRNAGYYLDSLAEDYYAVSTYNSTMNRNVQEFIQRLWPQMMTGYDLNHYDFINGMQESVPASLSGVKYLLSYDPDLELDGYEQIHQVGDIYIYRNARTENIASFFTDSMTEEEYEARTSELDTQKLLTGVLVTDEETDFEVEASDLEPYKAKLAKDPIDYAKMDKSVYTVDEEKGEILVQGEQVITIPLNTKALKDSENTTVRFRIDTDKSTSITISADGAKMVDRGIFNYSQYTTEFALPDGAKEIEITVADSSAQLTLSRFTFRLNQDEYTFNEDAQIEVQKPEKESDVTGSVEAKTDGLVMLAIPYEEGWSVSVDGEPVEILQADYGFIGFQVDEGSHTFEAKFEAPMMRTALYITLGCLAIWVLALIICILILPTVHHVKGKVSDVRTRKASKEAAETPFEESDVIDAEEHEVRDV